MTERVEECKLFESLQFTKLKPGDPLGIRQQHNLWTWITWINISLLLKILKNKY